VRIALDTNILSSMEGVDGENKRNAALGLVVRLPQNAIVIPVQVLGELFNVLVRKAGRSRSDARTSILSWRDSFSLIATSREVMLAAADLATDHRLSIWDAVVLSAAAQSDCRLLLSEDLQHGFTWGGTTVVNPFASPHHPLLAALLEDNAGSEPQS